MGFCLIFFPSPPLSFSVSLFHPLPLSSLCRDNNIVVNGPRVWCRRFRDLASRVSDTSDSACWLLVGKEKEIGKKKKETPAKKKERKRKELLRRGRGGDTGWENKNERGEERCGAGLYFWYLKNRGICGIDLKKKLKLPITPYSLYPIYIYIYIG